MRTVTLRRLASNVRGSWGWVVSPRLGPAPTKFKKLRAPTDIVRGFWERMEAREWDGARELLADDVVVIWPATREKFEGADAFIAMNQAYPGDWHIDVQSVLAQGREVLAWVEVRIGDQRSWCAQRATVTEKRIRSTIDLWVDEGSFEPPEWRVALLTGAGRASSAPVSTNDPVPAPNEEAS